MATEKIPWLLPRGWEWKTIEDVAEIAANLIDPANVPALPHVAPNHIESGTSRLLPYSTVREDGVTSPKHRFVPGQILYSKIRPYLRKAVIVDFEGVCSADMYPLNVQCDANYLLWWLLSPAFNEHAMEHQGRTVLPKINQKALYRMPVPVPPREEQERIAATMSSLFTRSRSAREELLRVERISQRYRQAVLAAAFEGRITSDWRQTHFEDARSFLRAAGIEPLEADDLPQLPKSWSWVSAGALCFIKSGIALGKKRETGIELVERPYLRVANVQRGWLNLDEIKTVAVTAKEAEALYLRPGDVLMNEGGDRDKLGRGWVWNGEIPECVHQNHVFRLRPRTREVPSRYISYYANEFGQAYFLREGKQTTNLASISMSKVSGLPIPIAPPDEMELIIRRIEAAFFALDRAEEEAGRASVLLDRLDQAILTKAFSGRLIPAALS